MKLDQTQTLVKYANEGYDVSYFILISRFWLIVSKFIRDWIVVGVGARIRATVFSNFWSNQKNLKYISGLRRDNILFVD